MRLGDTFEPMCQAHISLIGCHHLSINHFQLATGGTSLPPVPGRPLPEGAIKGSPSQSLMIPSVIQMPYAANKNKSVTAASRAIDAHVQPTCSRLDSSQMNCRSCAGRGANIRKVVYCNGNSNHCSNSGPFREGESETLPAGRAVLAVVNVNRTDSAGVSLRRDRVDAETDKLIDCPRACGQVAPQNETHEAVSGEASMPHPPPLRLCVEGRGRRTKSTSLPYIAPRYWQW